MPVSLPSPQKATSLSDTSRIAYYADCISGNDDRDGLSPQTAWKTWNQFPAKPGASLLLKRGCTFTLPLPCGGGLPTAPVVYGAYGEGAKPVLEGKMIDQSSPKEWIEESANIWRTKIEMSDVANVVFDDTACGNKRYTKEELLKQGEWFQDGSGTGAVFVHASKNPAELWRKIEIIPTGNGITLEGKELSHIRFEDLAIRKVGTHGIQMMSGSSGITILRCDFSLIGGAIYRGDGFSIRYGEQFIKRRVRYGNGIEIWSDSADVTVEGCRICEIFDGGFCVQGLSGSAARNVVARHNVFWNCGYDSLDVAHGIWVRDVLFENNTCVNAGEGWALQGESRPRYSLNIPDNLGYHCNLESSFNWDARCEVAVRHNIFYNAPDSRCLNYGPEKLSDLVSIDHNCYYQAHASDALVQMARQKFTAKEFDAYRKLSGWDHHSIIADPLFVNLSAGDFRLKPESPCVGMGSQAALRPE